MLTICSTGPSTLIHCLSGPNLALVTVGGLGHGSPTCLRGEAAYFFWGSHYGVGLLLLPHRPDFTTC